MKTYYNFNRTARAFYDPHIRLWTLVRLDSEGNQIGSAEYTTSRNKAMIWLVP